MEKYEQMKALLESIEKDVEKCFIKGNNQAGGRVRKAMQEIKVLAQEIRVEAQEARKAEKN